MPPVIAAITAAAVAAGDFAAGLVLAEAGLGAATAAATVGSLVAGVVEVGIYTGLSIGLALLTAPKIPGPGPLQTPLKQPMAARRSAFGTVRVSGIYALFTVEAQTSYDVLALLDGESQAFVGFYLNDDRVSVDAGSGAVWSPGAPTKYGGGPPGHKVHIFSRLGLATETAYAAVTGAVAAWDSAHRGDGVTSMAMLSEQSKAKDQQHDYPNGLPQPSAIVQAQKVYDPRDVGQVQGDASTYLWSDNPALCLLAYLTDAAGGMGLSYSRHIAPTVDFWKAAADDCDAAEATSGMHAALTLAAAAGATTLELADVTGLSGGVAIAFQDETVTVASVAGLIVTLTSGLAFDHSAGELVTWSGTGTEKRYRCSGTYLHDNAPGDVQKQILATFDGFLAPRGDGALVVYSGRYYAPTVTLSDANVVGYTLQHFQADEQAANQFVVSFTDPAANYNTGEAGVVQDDADITARGLVRSVQLGLDWVPSAGQAIRVANRQLARSTQALRGTVTTNLVGLNALGERFLRLQIADNPDLADLVVEVTDKATIDLANLTLTFSWVAADTTVETGTAGAGVTQPPLAPGASAPPALTAPTITALTAAYPESGAGVAGARILIDITAPVTSGVEWLARWKLAADSDWHESDYSDIADGASVELLTGFVPASGAVDVQVAYKTAAQISPWSATSTITLAAPVAGQPFGFAFQRAISGVVVSKSLIDFDSPLAWTLPAGLADCQAAIVDEGATGAAGPSAQTDFDIQRAGVSVGTLRFAASATSASFIKAADSAVSEGQLVSIVAPADLHGMAGRLTGAIRGSR